MNRIIQMVIFLSIFLIIYFSINSYVVLRLASLFKFQNRVVLFGLIGFLVAGFPLTSFIERVLPNLVTRIIYTISSAWLGVMFFLFTSLILYEIVRLFVSVDTKIAGIVILVLVGVLSIAGIVNASFVSVKDVEVPIPGLKEDLKVVQLTDLHIGTIRNSGFLETVVSKVNKIDPDIVVITGDLVDGTAPLENNMFNEFNKLRARVFFVSGNHETYAGDKVYELFEESKIEVLDNKVVTFDGIQIVGVGFEENKNHLAESLDKLKIDEKKPTILLHHAPWGMDAAKKKGIDLQLAGHTHYGQIMPFNLLVKIFFPKIKGLYDLDGMYLYVNPGTGTWGPYMRLGSRNEITSFNLKA